MLGVVPVYAQENKEISVLPLEEGLRPVSSASPAGAPSPSTATPPLVKSDQAKKRGIWYYLNPMPKNWEEAALWTGHAVDVVSTVQFMTHPRYVSTYNGIFRNMNYPGTFEEVGWFRFVGPRNAPGVVAATTMSDMGIIVLDRWLDAKLDAKKGKRWKAFRLIGRSCLFGKGLWQARIGIRNFRWTAKKERLLTDGLTPGSYFWHDKPIPH